MPTGTKRRMASATGRLTIAVLVVLALATFVAVLGSPSSDDPVGSIPLADRVPVPTPLAASKVTGIDVAALGISTTDVVDLGLRDDNSLDVPHDAQTVGWYDRSSSPGADGPAVFAGHVNYSGTEGTFSHLENLKPGDVVEVHRADGTTAVFNIDEVDHYPKDAFPTVAVYGPTNDPEIRLITCGGVFNPVKHSYDDNIVVTGTLVSAYRTHDA